MSEVFVGVHTLINRLSEAAVNVASVDINNELNEVVAELYLLYQALTRLRDERDFVDEEDVNRCLDKLMDG